MSVRHLLKNCHPKIFFNLEIFPLGSAVLLPLENLILRFILNRNFLIRQDALERNLHDLKEKEKTISKQGEVVEAIERANAQLNDECMRNKEKLAQSQVFI